MAGEELKPYHQLGQSMRTLNMLGTWGVSLVNGLGTEIYTDNQEQPFFAASINKLPIVVCALADHESDEAVPLQTPLEGSGRYDRPGGHAEDLPTAITVSEAIEDSIIHSGNTSAKSLARYVGVGRINDFAHQTLGLAKTHLEQGEQGAFTYGQTTSQDMIILLRQLHSVAPGVFDLLARSAHKSGVRQYQPPRATDLVVGSKHGALDEMGVRHEVGYIQLKGSARAEDTLFYAIFSESKVPHLAIQVIELIGARIYEDYFGYRAVSRLGRIALERQK